MFWTQFPLCNKNSHILHYSDNPTPLHSVQFIFINLVILQAFTQNIISVATAISRYTQQLLHNFLHLYNFEYTPASHKAQFFGDACAGPPGGIQPERRRHWRFLSC